MSPTVSVIIPTYNRATLLPRAIDSVIAQTYTDWELIIIDDGSTDDTFVFLSSYSEKLGDRLRVLHQTNTGPCAARNRGINASQGRFICFLDSDDEFLPNKLARQIELFDLRPELGFVYSDSACFDIDGRRHDSVFRNFAPHARNVTSTEIAPNLKTCSANLFDMLLREYFISTIVGMVRREVIGDSIRFQPDPAYAEEWLFYLMVARVCRVGFVDEPLCLHHQTPGSIARTDAHRNTLGRRTTLRTMLDSFNDLTRAQRRIIKQNLAATCDQLAYDFSRCNDRLTARCYWLESLKNRRSLQTLKNALATIAPRTNRHQDFITIQSSLRKQGESQNRDPKGAALANDNSATKAVTA